MKSYILTCFGFYLLALGSVSSQPYYNTDIQNPFVLENIFIEKTSEKIIPLAFEQAKPFLPQPEWEARPDVLAAYWKAWSIAFGNLYAPTGENGFVSSYVDAAFNRHIFMWDNSFMAMFGRYGRRAFNFQGALDNFYCKQHKDGFICREISEITGNENFQKYDVSSTGPNLLPWAEWEYFRSVNDTVRLRQVFPALVAFYQWYRTIAHGKTDRIFQVAGVAEWIISHVLKQVTITNSVTVLCHGLILRCNRFLSEKFCSIWLTFWIEKM